MGAPEKASNDVRKAGSWMATEGSVSGAGVEAQPVKHAAMRKAQPVRSVRVKPATTGAVGSVVT
jgi:hypothetical protein